VVIGEWIAAVLGSIFATCSDLNHPSTTLVELCFFVGMGTGCFVLLLNEILAEFSSTMLTLLALTGFFYLFGIVFFVLGEYKPIYHVIWHMCVVFAAAFHWFNVFFFVVTSDINGVSPTKAAVSEMVDSFELSLENAAQSFSFDLSDLIPGA
jgi:channel protein (hemolysin III family)